MFDTGDKFGQQNVIIVNQKFAEHYFTNSQASLEHPVALGGGAYIKFDMKIVGVVRNLRHTGIRDKSVPTFYRLFEETGHPTSMQYVLRMRTDPLMAFDEVRRAV